MNDNGRFKSKKVYFSQVSNEALRDKNLSLKAKGLYALIQSYITIEDFTLYKNTLRKECKEGEKAFESTWKELKDKGYLIQCKYKNEFGQFSYEYELLDVSQTPKKYPMENQTPKKEVVENVYSGKGGEYNNTDYNNTYLNNTYSNKEKETIIIEYKKVKSRTPSDKEIETLFNLCEIYQYDIVLKAIEVMSDRAEKPSISYLKTTLKDWASRGADTLDKVLENLTKHELNNTKANENKNKKIKALAEGNVTYGKQTDGFNDYDQRKSNEYIKGMSMEDIELKLRGY